MACRLSFRCRSVAVSLSFRCGFIPLSIPVGEPLGAARMTLHSAPAAQAQLKNTKTINKDQNAIMAHLTVGRIVCRTDFLYKYTGVYKAYQALPSIKSDFLGFLLDFQDSHPYPPITQSQAAIPPSHFQP